MPEFRTETKVRVLVKRPKSKSEVKQTPGSESDVRYGPFSRPEDDIEPPGVVRMLVCDLTTLLIITNRTAQGFVDFDQLEPGRAVIGGQMPDLIEANSRPEGDTWGVSVPEFTEDSIVQSNLELFTFNFASSGG